jgi:hypothetical protein
MSPEEFTPTRESYGKPRRFTIDAVHKCAYAPIKIRFEPRRSKDISAPHVKAIAIYLNGKEYPASSSDISGALGRMFFQNETAAISWPRLQMWLKGHLTYEEASCGLMTHALSQRQAKHRLVILSALEAGKAVNAECVKKYGVNVPAGYVQIGELWQPQGAAA